MKFIFLGTGPTKWVEGKGKNKRRNSSLLIRNKYNILIDVTPQFDEQIRLFAPDLEKIDFLLLTHGHTDATNGWYKLREWMKEHNQQKITVFCEKATRNRIKDDFSDLSFAKFIYIKPGKKIKIGNIKITPFRVVHAEAFPTGKKFPTLGFRINNIVYAEDCESIPEESEKYFKNAAVIIIDGAMWFGKQIRGHMNTRQALEVGKKFSPKYLLITQAGRTYPSYSESQKIIEKEAEKMGLKSKVKLTYDGMVIKQKRRLQVLKKDEEGETRSEIATRFWKNNWYKAFPSTGKGRFVYHHHWRGLTEEEKNWNEEKLLETERSVHGDLRLESDDALYGFTVFLGETSDVKKGRDIFTLKEPDKLQGTWKLFQPKPWLNFEGVTKPGEVGATAKKYAKFFIVDKGNYEIGVWREHFFEFFMHGKKLKGRFLIVYAPVGEGGRKWLIGRPEDQTPYAEKHDLESVVEELRKKGQKWLVWAKPGMKPKLINVKTYKTLSEKRFSIATKQLGNYKYLMLILEKENYCELWAFEPTKVGEKNRLVVGSKIKRMGKAPIEFLNFEGTIPKGKPGAHRNYPAIVKILDKGTYRIIDEEAGYVKYQFEGKKLEGLYVIKRIGDREMAENTKYRYVFEKAKEDAVLYHELLSQLELLLLKKERGEEKLFYDSLRVTSELKEGKIVPLKIKGIALREGTWNGLFYPREELRKSYKDLIGKPLMIDHSSSVRDLVGKVTNAWFNEALNAIEFEAEIIDEEIAKKVIEGLVKGVSVGVVVDRVKEGNHLVARNFEFKELSIVLVPACPDAKITDIETQILTRTF